MTRINVAVYPHELCDQHPIAEYRELPRLFSFEPKSGPPARFCLGRGHVLWCAAHMGSVAIRYLWLVDEMRHRGFSTAAYRKPAPKIFDEPRWTARDLMVAMDIVRARILERLATMQRVPKWTLRHKPSWAKVIER